MNGEKIELRGITEFRADMAPKKIWRLADEYTKEIYREIMEALSDHEVVRMQSFVSVGGYDRKVSEEKVGESKDPGDLIDVRKCTRDVFIDTLCEHGKVFRILQRGLSDSPAVPILLSGLSDEEYERTLPVRKTFFGHIYDTLNAADDYLFAHFILNVPTAAMLKSAKKKANVASHNEEKDMAGNAALSIDPRVAFDQLSQGLDEIFSRAGLDTSAGINTDRAPSHTLIFAPALLTNDGYRSYHVIVGVSKDYFAELGKYRGLQYDIDGLADVMVRQWLSLNHLCELESVLSTENKSHFGHLVRYGKVEGHELLDVSFFSCRNIKANLMGMDVLWLDKYIDYLIEKSLKTNSEVFMTPTTVTGVNP